MIYPASMKLFLKNIPNWLFKTSCNKEQYENSLKLITVYGAWLKTNYMLHFYKNFCKYFKTNRAKDVKREFMI